MSRLVYKNFFYLSLVQFSNYILPFLVIPLLTRTLGIDGYGKYAFYIGVSSFLLIVIRFGFEFSATRQISLFSDDKEKVAKIVVAVMLIKLGLLLATLVIYSLVTFVIKPDEQAFQLFLGGALLLAGQALLPIWYFQGMQKMKYVTVYTVATKIVYVGLLFALIRSSADYGFGVMIYGGAFFIAGLLSFYHVQKELTLRFSLERDMLKEVLSDALPYFKSRAFVASYTSSVVPIIGFVGDASQVAIYSASEKLYLAAKQLMQPLTNALFPYISKTQNVQLFVKIFIVSLCVLAIGASIVYSISPYIIEFLFGSDFKSSVELFKLHIIALVFAYPSLLLGYPLLGALGFSAEANNSVVWGCLIFFTLVALGIFVGVTSSEFFIKAIIAAEMFVFAVRAYFSFSRVIKKQKEL